MHKPSLLVTMQTQARLRHVVAASIGATGTITYLSDLEDAERAGALRSADVVLARNTASELRQGEAALLAAARLIQFVTAGVDYIPLGDLPTGVPVACNGGGYAEPMAEHAVAMTYAAAKRIVVEHDKLARGNFDQFRANRMLAGCVCGILGLGGIGVATARMMRALGLKVHAVNRSGRTDASVDWIGRSQDRDTLIRNADVLVLCVPLTNATAGMIGARELRLMKRDAILVNLARGEIVDEAALYAHLLENPHFTACIDAWWIEPVRHGHFRMDHPFMRLPNVIGSPHNSASVSGWRDAAIGRAALNAARALAGEAPLHIVLPEDRML